MIICMKKMTVVTGFSSFFSRIGKSILYWFPRVDVFLKVNKRERNKM